MPLPEFSSESGGFGAPAPLETLPAQGGAAAALKEGAAQSLLASGITRTEGALGDKTFVPFDAAKQEMLDQNYDPSVLPEGGLTRGYLDALMRQQSAMNRNREIADQAGLRHSTGWLPSQRGMANFVGQGAVDTPFFMLGGEAAGLGLGAAGIEGIAGAGTAARLSRAAVGAVESAGVGAAYDVGRREIGTVPGDKDIGLYQIGHDAMVFGALGGALGFVSRGAKPGMDAAIDHVLQEEGGLTTDTGGETKFGISAKAHPGVDIAGLDIGTARNLYKTEYWDRIGGDDLPGSMQLTALDSAVNQGVEKTTLWLKEAGGDPVKFNALRKAEYERLAAENPGKYGQFLTGWLNRLDRVSRATASPFASGEGSLSVRIPEDDINAVKMTLADALDNRIPDPTQPGGSRPAWQTPEIETQMTRAAKPEETLPQPAQMEESQQKLTPEVQELQQQAKEAIADAKATHATFSTPEQKDAFDRHMAGIDAEIAPMLDLHKAVEAAVKCGTLKGLE